MGPNSCQFLKNILYFHTVPMLNQVLTGNYVFCFYIWAEQLIRGVFHLDASICCWFSGIKFPFFLFVWWGGGCSVFTNDAEGSGVFIAEEVNGLGEARGQDIMQWRTFPDL